MTHHRTIARTARRHAVPVTPAEAADLADCRCPHGPRNPHHPTEVVVHPAGTCRAARDTATTTTPR